MTTTTPPPNGEAEDRGVQLMVMMWVLTAFSGLTVILRFFFRARKSAIGWDDVFMLGSMVFYFQPP
jgi:hypothetical protein